MDRHTNTIANEQSRSALFTEASVYLMIFVGIIGMILIPMFCIHALYNFKKRNIKHDLSHVLYVIYFTVCWMICFGYTFLKVDVIFPMGISIDCRVGQYFISSCVLFSEIGLTSIILYRIDKAFNDSALAYPRKLLFIIWISYTVFMLVANIFYVVFSYDTISLVELSSGIGICTLGEKIEKKMLELTVGLAVRSLIDIIYLITMCGMFVYKLNKVVKMAAGASSSKRIIKFKQLIKKQTILVCFACISSILMWCIGGFIPSIGILLHIDTIVNTFCVWLMFKYSDYTWYKLVAICCCYCCCQNQDENQLTTIYSVSGNSGTSPRSVNENKHTATNQTGTIETTQSKCETNDIAIEITCNQDPDTQ